MFRYDLSVTTTDFNRFHSTRSKCHWRASPVDEGRELPEACRQFQCRLKRPQTRRVERSSPAAFVEIYKKRRDPKRRGWCQKKKKKKKKKRKRKKETLGPEGCVGPWLTVVNNETLYIDELLDGVFFFHRMKWNCLDAFNASATLRGTPLWYPLSQFPATRHYPLSPPFHPSLSLSPSPSFLSSISPRFLFSTFLSPPLRFFVLLSFYTGSAVRYSFASPQPFLSADPARYT